MKKIYIFIFLFFIFLVLACSLFFISKKIISGSVVSDKDKPDYSSETMSSPEDKNCFQLLDGKVACKVGSVEISEGKISELDSDQ